MEMLLIIIGVAVVVGIAFFLLQNNNPVREAGAEGLGLVWPRQSRRGSRPPWCQWPGPGLQQRLS
jgi:hypothetical protein